MKRVLFLSRHNAGRSIMAEALLKHHANGELAVFSAGYEPMDEIDIRTIKCLSEFGISTDGLTSKAIEEFDGQCFDQIILLCATGIDDRLTQKVKGAISHWHFESPRSKAGMSPFTDTLKDLNERLKMFLLIERKNGVL